MGERLGVIVLQCRGSWFGQEGRSQQQEMTGESWVRAALCLVPRFRCLQTRVWGDRGLRTEAPAPDPFFWVARSSPQAACATRTRVSFQALFLFILELARNGLLQVWGPESASSLWSAGQLCCSVAPWAVFGVVWNVCWRNRRGDAANTGSGLTLGVAIRGLRQGVAGPTQTPGKSPGPDFDQRPAPPFPAWSFSV